MPDTPRTFILRLAPYDRHPQLGEWSPIIGPDGAKSARIICPFCGDPIHHRPAPGSLAVAIDDLCCRTGFTFRLEGWAPT